MSRSRPEQDKVNPAKKFFEWKGSTGTLEYYDKEAKESVVVDLPFTFLVLDQLNTVDGFDPSMEMGYYANEVRDNFDELTVRNKKGVVATGTWDALKNSLKGIKFCKSVYIAYKEGDELVIGNIQAKGAFLSEWFEYASHTSLMSGAITVRKGEKVEKKGLSPYYKPTFSSKEVSDETNREALELDIMLQKYLDSYFSKRQPVLAESTAEGADYPPTEMEMKSRAAAAEADISVPATQENPDDEIPF